MQRLTHSLQSRLRLATVAAPYRLGAVREYISIADGSVASPGPVTIETAKRIAAEFAVQNHFDSQAKYIGIGSGSTIVHVVKAIRDLPASATIDTTFVPTGSQSRQLLLDHGFRIAEIDTVPGVGDQHKLPIDIGFDGADEVDFRRNCIKGGGGCLFLEKLVAVNAKTFIVVADHTKISKSLSTVYKSGVPIEVVPVSAPYVLAKLTALGAVNPTLRITAIGPFVTDNGNYIIDAPFPRGIISPELKSRKITPGEGRGLTEVVSEKAAVTETAKKEIGGLLNKKLAEVTSMLNSITGVVEHGIFSLYDKQPEVVYFGMEEGTVMVNWNIRQCRTHSQRKRAAAAAAAAAI